MHFLPGFFGGRSLVIVGVGASTSSPTAPTMNYATVSFGAAPQPGDLVKWGFRITDSGMNSAISTPSGWTLTGSMGAGETNSAAIYDKIIAAGDISSPPTPITGDGTIAGIGMWIAARPTFAAQIDTVTSPVGFDTIAFFEEGDPSAVSVDESASIQPGIIASFHSTNTASFSSGSWSGATEQIIATAVLGGSIGMKMLAKVYGNRGPTADSVTADMDAEGTTNHQMIGASWLIPV